MVQGVILCNYNNKIATAAGVLGAIQVLRNAAGGRGVSDFPGKSVTKVKSSMLLVLRGGGWRSNIQKKSVT